MHDTKGDMGFMEAVLSMMAVVLALTAFFGAVMLLTASDHGQSYRFDAGMLDGEITDGEFVPGYQDYLREYLDASGKKFVSVDAEIPGGFCGEIKKETAGTDPGRGYTSLFSAGTASDDAGRRIPVWCRVVFC